MAGWKIVSCPFDLSGKRIYRKSRAPISLAARILENRGENNEFSRSSFFSSSNNQDIVFHAAPFPPHNGTAGSCLHK